MKIRDKYVDVIYIRTYLWIMYLWSLRSVIFIHLAQPYLSIIDRL